MMTREQIGLVGWQLHEGTWVEAHPLSSNIEILRKEALALYDRAEKAEEAMDFTYCAYCGEQFPLDDGGATNVGKHIAICPKHPMRDVEAERDALKVELQRLIKAANVYMRDQTGDAFEKLVDVVALIEAKYKIGEEALK